MSILWYTIVNLKERRNSNMNQPLVQDIGKEIRFIENEFSDEKFESIMGTEYFHPLTNNLGLAYRQAKAEFNNYIADNQYEKLNSYAKLRKFEAGLMWRKNMLKATFEQLEAVRELVNKISSGSRL